MKMLSFNWARYKENYGTSEGLRLCMSDELAVKHPELVTALNQIKLAEIAIDAIMEKLVEEEKYGDHD